MQKSSQAEARRSLLLCLFILGLVTAIIVLPTQFGSVAAQRQKGLIEKTVSDEPDLPNYDIRDDANSKGAGAIDSLTKFRQSAGKDASMVADIRDSFVRGEEALRAKVPTLKVDYNDDIRIPEIIGPDVWKKRAFLTEATSPAGTKHADVLINFLKENNSLIGATDEQINGLKVFADYTNPDGNLSFVELDQEINGIPVFRGEVKAGFTKSGEMIRVINNFAPGLDYASLSTDFHDPLDAVRRAAENVNWDVKKLDLTVNSARSSDTKITFGDSDYPTTAEKMYFPTEPGIARPAWRVLIYKDVPAYYVIVDAETGTILWRKNIVNDQTQSATYNVYSNTTSLINVLDSPAPLTPGPIDPNLGTQGTQVARTNVSLIGNEAPNTFNNNGWITDNTNGANGETQGNAVIAGVDLVAPDGVDAPTPGTNRVFSFAYNPPPGMPAPPTPITDQVSRDGAVTQLFYICNRYHDIMYRMGFTELARNFQLSNFARGGAENDRVSAEAQDSSGTNNANFLTPADGTRGRMQMYRFTNTPDNRDGDVDADVVIHEHTHGLSNRLIGNGSGLGNNRGGSMGEGWSDFYGTSLLAEPTDPVNGVYTTGAYVTFQVSAFGIGTNNTYYGIRRMPYAPIAFLGGPQNRPHDPRTAGDVNSGCSLADGAFPPLFTGTCNEVHNAGEVWVSMLMEVRAKFVARLGQAAGTQRVLQIVTDGMKLSPLSPNFQNERDSIIAAAQAASATPETAADVLDVREGFRIRGMGFSATDNGTTVVEAFDAADLSGGSGAVVTSGNNLLEPNECNTLNIPLVNNSGNAVSNVSAVLSSSTPGITVTQANSTYANIPGGGGPVNNNTPFQVSVANTVACFTNANFTLTVTYTGGGGGSPLVYNFSLPVGIPGTNYAFTSGTGGTIPSGGTLVAGSQVDDGAVSITLPSGWNSTVYGQAVTSLSASTNGMLTVNGTAATTFTNTALIAAVGGTNPTLFPAWDDYNLSTTAVSGGGIYINTVGSAPNRTFYVEWRGPHFDEPDPSPISNNFAVKLTEGSDTIQYIYVLTGISPNINGASATVGVQRSNAAGSPFTQVGFNTSGTITPGMTLTGARPPGQCTPGSGTCNAVTVRAPYDFDGDHKTDVSIFRPGPGEWWYIRSIDSVVAALTFGTSTDIITPGDFTGDGKADQAFFRPSTSTWFVLRSEDGSFYAFPFGTTGDIPIVGDYDGDGKADPTIFRPSTNTWFILKSSGGTDIIPFGAAGDRPVVGDWDGDGKTDIAIFRPSGSVAGAAEWWVLRSTAGLLALQFGSNTDRAVAGDYTGDGKTDCAFFRPSTNNWYVLRSEDFSYYAAPFGAAGDIPVPGDYDGDGKFDFGVFRPSNTTWFLQRSTAGNAFIPFGNATDTPVPSRGVAN
jgi:hypothetical protein